MTLRSYLMESDIDDIEATVADLVEKVKLARVECEDENVRVMLRETIERFEEKVR